MFRTRPVGVEQPPPSSSPTRSDAGRPCASFPFGGFEIHRHHVALDQLGNLGADHVGAEKLAVFLSKITLTRPWSSPSANPPCRCDERKRPTRISRFWSLAACSVSPTEAICGKQ